MRRFPRAQFRGIPAPIPRIIAGYAKCLKSCRTAFRSAGCHFQRASDRQTSSVVVQVRLRKSDHSRNGSFEARRENQLRVRTSGDGARLTSQPWADRNSDLEAVARHGQPLHSAKPEKLASVWRARDSHLRALAGFRELPGRHGRMSERATHAGSLPEQRRQLRVVELPLGNLASAAPQSLGHTLADIQGRDALRGGMVRPLGNKSANHLRSHEQRATGRGCPRYARKIPKTSQALARVERAATVPIRSPVIETLGDIFLDFTKTCAELSAGFQL